MEIHANAALSLKGRRQLMIMEFPRFRGHLKVGLSGVAGRMSVDAKDTAVFTGVPQGSRPPSSLEWPVGSSARGRAGVLAAVAS